MTYRYLTNCTHARGRDIDDMIDVARDISWKTCWKYLDRTKVHEMLGYDRETRRGGLTLESDYAVPKPCRSTYRGQRCIYITWSMIEYIFVA